VASRADHDGRLCLGRQATGVKMDSRPEWGVSRVSSAFASGGHGHPMRKPREEWVGALTSAPLTRGASHRRGVHDFDGEPMSINRSRRRLAALLRQPPKAWRQRLSPHRCGCSTGVAVGGRAPAALDQTLSHPHDGAVIVLSFFLRSLWLYVAYRWPQRQAQRIPRPVFQGVT
jgi:hypothetical protein